MNKETLIELIEEGLSQQSIADRLGCGQTNVRYWLKKFNLKTKTKRKSSLGNGKISKIHSVDWAFIQKEYDSGLGYREIEKKHGIYQVLLNQARKLGYIKTRNNTEATQLWIEKSNEEQKLQRFSHKGNSSGKKGGYRAKAGRSKKYHVKDSFGNEVCLQSSYEKRTAEILDDLGIKWIRPKHLKYDDKKYFPDFFLIDKNIYLDPKNNFLAIKDKEKIERVREQNNVVVLILTSDKINGEFLTAL